MSGTQGESVKLDTRYRRILAPIVKTLRSSPTCMGVYVYGSLANRTLWERSNIDLVVLLEDDRPSLKPRLLYSRLDGVEIKVELFTRRAFLKQVQLPHGPRQELADATLATAEILYDPQGIIGRVIAEIREYPRSRRATMMVYRCAEAVRAMRVATKFVRLHEPTIALEYIFEAVRSLGLLLLARSGRYPRKEWLSQMRVVDGAYFQAYQRLTRLRCPGEVDQVLGFVDGRLRDLANEVAEPIREAILSIGPPASVPELGMHFRTVDIFSLELALGYLADSGAIVECVRTTRIDGHASLGVYQERAFATYDLT